MAEDGGKRFAEYLAQRRAQVEGYIKPGVTAKEIVELVSLDEPPNISNPLDTPAIPAGRYTMRDGSIIAVYGVGTQVTLFVLLFLVPYAAIARQLFSSPLGYLFFPLTALRLRAWDAQREQEKKKPRQRLNSLS